MLAQAVSVHGAMRKEGWLLRLVAQYERCSEGQGDMSELFSSWALDIRMQGDIYLPGETKQNQAAEAETLPARLHGRRGACSA
mmetsp:Transcript_41142/g.74319  ORF Transcript_41142/g.74319 Transcript_41142/m.74319 type:complete len:83 (+) Transcript_41142:1-249(+)